MARRFLYVFAFLIALVLAAAGDIVAESVGHLREAGEPHEHRRRVARAPRALAAVSSKTAPATAASAAGRLREVGSRWVDALG